MLEQETNKSLDKENTAEINLQKEDKKSKKKKEKKSLKDVMNLDVKDVKKKIKDVKKKNKKKNEKKREVVAFDIGTRNIKVVVGMFYKGQMTINKLIKIPIPDGTIVDGAISDEKLLFSKIQKAIKIYDINTKDAIITNNSASIINREMTIPMVQEEELDTVIRFEIQQYLPIDLNDYVLQVTLLKERPEEMKMDVRVIAYPEKIARGYYDLLKSLDLRPYALDVNYNAINKFYTNMESIDRFKYTPSANVAFIDIGANNLDFSIYGQGVLKFTRIQKAGGNNIDTVLKQSLGISEEEIVEFKENQLSLKTDRTEYQNLDVITEITDWIEKIEKIIQFYKNQNVGASIDKIFIHGGSSQIEGLDEFMTAKLGIDTQKVTDISKLNIKIKKNDYAIEEFINAIGSIIRL